MCRETNGCSVYHGDEGRAMQHKTHISGPPGPASKVWAGRWPFDNLLVDNSSGGCVWTGGGWGVVLCASKQWDELSMAYLFAIAPTPPDIPIDGRFCLCHYQVH